MKYILFTDLDGTLLDSETYEFRAAVAAIKFLKKNSIPIIPCTSKTHREVISLRKKLQINDPFVVENGSAIFYPPDYFMAEDWQSVEVDGYRVRVLGKTYQEILDFLTEMRSRYNLDIQGFNEMNAGKISELTSLNISEAKVAKTRYFSEPFVVNDGKDLPEKLYAEVKKQHFRLLKGNRFYHLLGNCDKGEAVRILSTMYNNLYNEESITTIGIGDSMNDFEMLQNVDFPVLVKKMNGQHQHGINLNNLMLTIGVGPEGWNEAVFKLVQI